jgi:hypothetical protein
MAMGTIGRTHWSAIITYRGSTIRIISVRRSTPSETEMYEKTQPEATTAKNLERKFGRGEDVLDYFNVKKARVIEPQSKASVVKSKSSGMSSAKASSSQIAVVHEKAASYHKKK